MTDLPQDPRLNQTIQAFSAYMAASEVARVAIGVIEAALKKGLHHSRPSLEQAVPLLKAQLTDISLGLDPNTPPS
jgi:hypothetical protein